MLTGQVCCWATRRLAQNTQVKVAQNRITFDGISLRGTIVSPQAKVCNLNMSLASTSFATGGRQTKHSFQEPVEQGKVSLTLDLLHSVVLFEQNLIGQRTVARFRCAFAKNEDRTPSARSSAQHTLVSFVTIQAGQLHFGCDADLSGVIP